jgi:hypothetical protein
MHFSSVTKTGQCFRSFSLFPHKSEEKVNPLEHVITQKRATGRETFSPQSFSHFQFPSLHSLFRPLFVFPRSTHINITYIVHRKPSEGKQENQYAL